MDLDELYRLLRGSHVQAQGIVDTIRDPLLVLSPDYIVISANPAFYRTFDTHRDATIGVALHELGNGQWDIEELRLLLKAVIPKAASVIDYEVQAKFPHIGQRTMLISAQRLKHPDNGQRVLLLSIVDATTRRTAERDKDILIGELDHRTKNLMAVTVALARQTRVEGRTAEEYRDILLGRLEALGRAIEVSAIKAVTELPALAYAILEPYLGDKHGVAIAEGPPVSLRPAQAVSLGLILHELSTNAVKHGALLTPEGQIDIGWGLEADADGHPQVHLCWTEKDGPPRASSATEGFGTRLIRYAAEHELGGHAELTFGSKGLTANIVFAHT